MADGLASIGVGRGDRDGMIMSNHLRFAPIKVAIARAGSVAEISDCSSAQAKIVGQVPPGIVKAHRVEPRAYGTY